MMNFISYKVSSSILCSINSTYIERFHAFGTGLLTLQLYGDCDSNRYGLTWLKLVVWRISSLGSSYFNSKNKCCGQMSSKAGQGLEEEFSAEVTSMMGGGRENGAGKRVAWDSGQKMLKRLREGKEAVGSLKHFVGMNSDELANVFYIGTHKAPQDNCPYEHTNQL